MVTLTKEGHKLLSRGKVLDSSQATYTASRSPRKPSNDADLYKLYHKVSDEIGGRGGSVVRVKLDYEMKRELYARLARNRMAILKSPPKPPKAPQASLYGEQIPLVDYAPRKAEKGETFQ